MTEDEAKQRWCPFSRYTSFRGYGINRWVEDFDTQLNPDPAHCIGSACMAWRWESKEYIGSVTPGIGPTVHSYRDRQSGEPTDGYCGLAGSL